MGSRGIGLCQQGLRCKIVHVESLNDLMYSVALGVILMIGDVYCIYIVLVGFIQCTIK